MTTTRYRLSFAQERLFFIDRLDPGSSAYLVVNAVRLRGPLEVDALAAAVASLVARHDALRSRFGQNAAGTPFQWIVDEEPRAFAYVDASDRSDDAFLREARAAAFAPVDLATGPLVRVVAFRRGPDDHVLACSVHHIVFDGWSWGVFMRELGLAYAAHVAGTEPALPPLKSRFVDFASWQRKTLEGGKLEAALGFWREALSGGNFVLDLPTDRPRPAHPTFAGGIVTRALSRDDSDRVRRLAQARGATPFAVLLAAFHALLAKHTGARDVVVGTPVAGRTHRSAEGMVGFFVNTLPLRARIARETTFAALVDQVRGFVGRAFEHQEVPLAKLVEAVNPERDRSRSPLFQVTFTMDVAAPSASALGLSFEPFEIGEPTSAFDLSMAVSEEPDGTFGCVLNHATDLFDAATAERMLERWRFLLAEALRAPERALDDIAWIPPAEREAVLRFATGASLDPTWAPLPERATAIARAHADVLAVRDGERRFTYAIWESATNRLAHALRAAGVGVDAIVGVSFPRSAELVAGAWAAMKSGAAFVPLDPDLPEERLRGMAEDVRASVVLVARGQGARWERLGLRAIEVDLDALAHSPCEPLGASVPDAALVYVIFTSGSTGRPKAAMNTHRGMRAYLEREQREDPLVVGDVMVLKAPCAFDLSVHEMFCPLFNGATLEIARPGGHRDPDYLVELFAARGVTACLFVPSMLDAFLDRAAGASLPTLTTILSAGEALSPALAAKVRNVLPRVRLVNGYGPAETCPTSTKHVVGDVEVTARVPIGRPPAGTRAYVVDEELRLLPIGVPGEIVTAGVQVGRGYFQRASLTAERFVPDPFAAQPGARMYRTGDRGRMNAAGELEYLQRFDHQIKLRGMRIELGEIEANLLALDGVAACVVVVRGGGGQGSETLAAYVVPSAGAAIAAATLREGLAKSLPAYMIPTSITLLDALPLNPNGKVDRARLPAPALAGDEKSDAFVPPRTPTETVVARVWAEALGRPTVGVYDDFFAAGGHSLLALTVVSRVERELSVRVPLAALFEEPTVARMSIEIDRRSSAPDPWLVPLQLATAATASAQPEREPVFVLPGISGDPRHLVTIARRLGPDRTVHGCFAAWRETGEAPPETLAGAADAHLAAIRRARAHGPYRLVGYSAGCALSWEIAHRLRAEGERVSALVLVDGLAPGMTDRAFVDAAEAWLACFARGGVVRVSDLRRAADDPWLDELVTYGLGRHAPVTQSRETDPILDAADHALVRVCAATLTAIGSATEQRCWPGRAVLVLGRRSAEREALRRAWGSCVSELVVRELDADHASIVAEPFAAEIARIVAEEDA